MRLRRPTPAGRAVVHFAAIVTLAAVAVAASVGRYGADAAGLGAPSLAAVASLPVAWLVGRLLLIGELMALARMRRVRRRGVRPGLEVVPSSRGLRVLTDVRFLAVAATAEELLWRSGAITLLTLGAGLSPVRAVIATGVLFGLRHYHFGGANALLKIAHGLAWGSLFVLTGSVVPALVSHVTYDYFVWRRLRRTRGALVVGTYREEVGDAARA